MKDGTSKLCNRRCFGYRKNENRVKKEQVNDILLKMSTLSANLRQTRTKMVRQMRRQIFRQIKPKAEGILDVFTSILVKYDRK